MADKEHLDSIQNYSDLADNFIINRAKTIKKRDFSKLVSQAMQKTAPVAGEENKTRYRSKEEKIEALDNILNSDKFKDLDSSEVMELFSAYRSLRNYDRMIETFRKTNSKDFKEAALVRETVAVAMRKRYPHEKDDLSNSMSMSWELVANKQASSITYDNIGKCLGKMTGEKASSQMLDVFEQGFAATLEPALGMRAVRTNMYLGNNERAKQTAKVVFLSALRDGADESRDFYTVSSALQAACIAGEDKEVIDHLCCRLAASLDSPHQFAEFEKNMRKIEEAGLNPQGIKYIHAQTAEWKSRINEDALKGGLIVWNEQGSDERSFGNDPKLEAIVSHSYSYRGCGSDFRGTNRVGGNMAFGGQLPDHTISKKDLELFTGLVEKTPAELGIKGLDKIPGVDPNLKLSEIEDPEMFMRLSDKFIRQTFTTENFAGTGLHMEENALAKNKNGESVYDATVKAVIRSCGKRMEKDADIDTRTNISAIFALGMGDCRHHAQVKQIMFDMYQRVQMNKQLSHMYDQVKKGRQIDLHGDDAEKFFNVLNTEVRTTDVQVRMLILMKQKIATEWRETDEKDAEGKKVWKEFPKLDAKGNHLMRDIPYSPDLDEKGRYKVDSSGLMHNLEDHTLCWVLKKDRKGNLTSFGMRDAFYQDKHYRWGNMDVDVDKIKISSHGKLMIPAGVIPAEKTSTGVPLRIYQMPTIYNTGRRDTFETRSIGTDVCLVGMRLNGFSDVDSFLKRINAREKMGAIMMDMLKRDPMKNTPDMNYAPEKSYKEKAVSGTKQKALSLDEIITLKNKYRKSH